MKRQPHPKPFAPPSPTPFLLTSLFFSGACCLVLEIVGTRLISPFYGSSIYTWSALITTTMVALAWGYAWGGRLGDRDPHLTVFARLLLAAGLTVAVIPVLREPVLRASAPLGVKLGALTAAAILVGPALALLGTLGPIATRLTATGASDAGHRSGDAWAVSTLGSVAGAALAGFVLIPHWPCSRILFSTAALLVALGAWGSWLSARRLPLGQLAACAACLVLALRAEVSPHASVLRRVESLYGRIEVFDGRDQRYLLVNGTAQSSMNTATGLSGSEYARAVEWSLALRPNAKTALALGLGAGLLPKALERRGLTVDSVEIDPEIVRTARDFFGFAPKGRVLIDDARAALETSADHWDLMLLDAFGSESPPSHLFTVEAFSRMRESMTPGGVLAVNLVTALGGPAGAPWRATYKTLAQAFPRVRAFVAAPPTEGLTNVLFFASTGSLDAPLPAMIFQELSPSQSDLDDVPAMTDDHAPLDSLLAATAVRWRRLLQKDLSEILLR